MTDPLILFDANLPWIYRWTRDGRHGQGCKIVTRAKDKTCLIEFADGHRMVVNLKSLRRRKRRMDGNPHA